MIGHLASKTALAAEALTAVIKVIAASRTKAANEQDANDEAAVTTIATICQRQDELPALPDGVCRNLVNRP